MSKFVELFQLAQSLPFWKDWSRDKKKSQRACLAFLQAGGIISGLKIKGVKLFQKSLAFRSSRYSHYMWHILKNWP